MTAEEALEIVERILPPGTLTPVQTLVFRRSWTGEEYAAIAKESGYDYGYIRDTGAQLWRSLSEVLREPVKKKNFRSLIQQRFSDQPMFAKPRTVVEKPDSPEIPEFPGGPVPLHSKFYVDRSVITAKAYAEISKFGGLLHIKAPWKMGKSSFLLRIADHAATLNYRIASLDFKQADDDVFSDLAGFLRWLCINISLQLELEPKIDQYWDTSTGSKVSCTLYLSRYLLRRIDAPLVLVLNELDQVLEHPGLCREFLMLLRSWYEEAKQVPILQKLRVVLAYSTDVCIPLKLSQSPFNNVGLPIELPELTVPEVEQLAERYELAWSSPDSTQQLMSLVGGHPYLMQLALYHLWSGEVSLEQLVQDTSALSKIYNHHLQSCLAILQANPDLAEVFKQIIDTDGDICPDFALISRLEGLGLIKSEANQIRVRCQLYQHYFSVQLPLILNGV